MNKNQQKLFTPASLLAAPMNIAMFFPTLFLTITRTEKVLATTRPSTLHHRYADASAREATTPWSHCFGAYVFLKVLFGETASLYIELELPDVPETA